MQIMAHQLWQTDGSAICLTAVPSRVPEEAQITGSENGGWGNTTPYKGSFISLYSFQAAGHCPQHKPIFAPRAFYKSHRLSSSFYKQEHKGEKGLGQGHRASLSESQKQILNLVVLVPAPGPFWREEAVGCRCLHAVDVVSQSHLH